MNQVQQFFEYIFKSLKIWVIVQPWETGIRVRNGKKIKKLIKGIYFRIPYFDSVYIQESRLRVSEVAKYVYKHRIEDINPETIGDSVLKELKIKDYGLNLLFKNNKFCNS